MDEVKIYKEYFCQKYDEILKVIMYYYSQGKRIAVWGAGIRGRVFLEIFDPEQKYICEVYDKDVKKHGTFLETGHKIVDFRDRNIDIIILASNFIEVRVSYELFNTEKKALLLNIDHIILGDLKAEDIIMPHEIKQNKVRKCKIAAVVVAYYPDKEVIENVKSYASDVDVLYFHDNSEVKDVEIELELKKIQNLQYFFEGTNEGLSVPFNRYYKKAIEAGMDWFITFDQDSLAKENMILEMKTFVESEECDEKIGIVSPIINDIDTSFVPKSIYYTYSNFVIQSGAMHRLSMMKEVGDYNEELFIDNVDYEYCVRCRNKGFFIIRVNTAILVHNQEDRKKEKFINGKTMYINKFSSYRYYYICRNAQYCYDKYNKMDPLYGIWCLNVLKDTKVALQQSSNVERNTNAIKLAQKHYEKGIMGKCKERL